MYMSERAFYPVLIMFLAALSVSRPAFATGSFFSQPPAPAPTPAPASPAPPASSPPVTPLPTAPPTAAPSPAPTGPTSLLPPSPSAPPSTAGTQAPAPTPPISGTVTAYSTDGWPIIGTQVLPLFGIDGIVASAQPGLQAWISSMGNSLTCTPQPGGAYRCLSPQGVDIAEGAILNGAGRATPDAPQLYQNAEQQAQTAKRGIWQ